MKKMLNEWRKFVNEAEQISEEQKDPDKISQARLDGATDWSEGGSMERADKWEDGPYFDDYEDAYYTAREEEDRQDYYADLEEDLDEGEDSRVRKMTPAGDLEYFEMLMDNGDSYIAEYDPSSEKVIVYTIQDAGEELAARALRYIQQDAPYDQERFPEPEEMNEEQLDPDKYYLMDGGRVYKGPFDSYEEAEDAEDVGGLQIKSPKPKFSPEEIAAAKARAAKFGL